MLKSAAAQTGRTVLDIEPSALEKLVAYSWPGNVRELRNVIERAVILAKGRITVADLPDNVRHLSVPAIELPDLSSLKDRERSTILATLESCKNNRRLAAEKLGISRRTLQYRLKEYGLVES